METDGFVIVKKKHAAKRNKKYIKKLIDNDSNDKCIDFEKLINDIESKK